jgi:hypothetical protein
MWLARRQHTACLMVSLALCNYSSQGLERGKKKSLSLTRTARHQNWWTLADIHKEDNTNIQRAQHFLSGVDADLTEKKNACDVCSALVTWASLHMHVQAHSGIFATLRTRAHGVLHHALRIEMKNATIARLIVVFSAIQAVKKSGSIKR